MFHQPVFPYYQSAASYSTSFVTNVPLNTAGYSYEPTFSTTALHGHQIYSTSYVSTVPLYLNSAPSNATPTFGNVRPSLANLGGPPEFTRNAVRLATMFKDQAVVFRNAQGREMVYCSICCQYGSSSTSGGYGYHSTAGSANLSTKSFKNHLESHYHGRAEIAKEKGKQPLELEPGATAPVPGATAPVRATSVSLLQQLVNIMEKVSTSVEDIKVVLNEKL